MPSLEIIEALYSYSSLNVEILKYLQDHIDDGIPYTAYDTNKLQLLAISLVPVDFTLDPNIPSDVLLVIKYVNTLITSYLAALSHNGNDVDTPNYILIILDIISFLNDLYIQMYSLVLEDNGQPPLSNDQINFILNSNEIELLNLLKTNNLVNNVSNKKDYIEYLRNLSKTDIKNWQSF